MKSDNKPTNILDLINYKELFNGGTILTEGDHLNTLLKPGTYYTDLPEVYNFLENKPPNATSNFIVFVFQGGSSIYQVVLCRGGSIALRDYETWRKGFSGWKILGG